MKKKSYPKKSIKKKVKKDCSDKKFYHLDLEPDASYKPKWSGLPRISIKEVLARLPD